jgi:hypothetical protein
MRLRSRAAVGGLAVLLAPIALTLVMSVNGPIVLAQAQQPTDPNANVAKKAPPPGSRKTSVWTQERMRTAKPTPIPRVDPNTIKKSGPAQPGRPASGNSRDTGQGSARVSGDVAGVPLKWAGKLFYEQPNGGFVCSGQFVSYNVVLTAAHCLRDDATGAWFEDFVFSLQYNKGRSTANYGYDCVMTKRGWVATDGSQWNFDYGLIRVLARSATGYFGWHANWSPGTYRRATKVGYPGDILNGEVVQMDSGPLAEVTGEDDMLSLSHGNPRNAGGSSGGAWVANFSRSAAGANGNRVISVTSHHRGDDTTVSYGVRLGTGFLDMLEDISRGC